MRALTFRSLGLGKRPGAIPIHRGLRRARGVWHMSANNHPPERCARCLGDQDVYAPLTIEGHRSVPLCGDCVRALRKQYRRVDWVERAAREAESAAMSA